MQVDADGGALGVLTITDTASARQAWNIDALPAADPGAPTGTYGVFVTQTSGDMQVNRILTNGDASLVALNGALRDARLGGLGDNTQFSQANVEANNIDLAAYCSVPSSVPDCGDVGARGPPTDGLGNDFKIDSGHGDSQNPSTVIVGRVGIEAQQNISVTETIGALNVLIAQSLSGNVRLTVREHAGQGDDLNLILPYASDTIAPTQNRDAILVDYAGAANVSRAISASSATVVTNSASINAQQGWILLRAGDNVTLGGLQTALYPDATLTPLAPNALTDAERIAQNTKVVAGLWIDIHGDFDAFSSGATDLDLGFGTVMHLHGTITPGKLTTRCANEIDPGRDCNVTRIFGNTDTDTFNFDQTFLGGRTRVFGSRTSTCDINGTACVTPSGDSEDFFNVNQLQTMFDPAANSDPTKAIVNGDVVAGHTLTLDGQAGTDTYVINTTGSQPCLGANQIAGSTCHNYVINVLDTGGPADGTDVLTVNGIDNTTCSGYKPDGATPCPTDDIFLLRASKYIASTPTSSTANEIADDPAFVALLHGNFGTATTAYTGDLALCFTNACGSVGQTLVAVNSVTRAPITGVFNTGTFVVGQRIHLGGGDSGIWAGDYTIASIAANGSSITLAETLPVGVSLTTEQVPTADVQLHSSVSAALTIGILNGDVTTSDPNPSTDTVQLRNQSYERINYDTAINGRLIVNGLGGNDYFAVDDETTTTTLDGGAGNDSFQIGQIYGLERDPLNAAGSPVNAGEQHSRHLRRFAEPVRTSSARSRRRAAGSARAPRAARRSRRDGR